MAAQVISFHSLKLFNTATKVKSADYKGDWLFWEEDKGNDGYFACMDDLLGWCIEKGHEPPDYVWACTFFSLAFDAEEFVEIGLEEHHEGAEVKSSEIQILQTLLDAWCTAQNIKTYECDYGVAVLLSEEEKDSVRKKIHGNGPEAA